MFTKFGTFGLAIVVMALMGCNTAPRTTEARQTLRDQTSATVADFKEKDPGMQRFFDGAYAYAVFPAVKEGAVGVGGAYGHGEVFRNGSFLGYCNMSQATIGVQLGGQSFAEIIFFQNKGELDAFQANQLSFDAAASAVAAASGASATADYKKGVVVFTKAQGGLMVQAAIGGQKFTFEPNTQTATEQP